jgi:NTE family protein
MKKQLDQIKNMLRSSGFFNELSDEEVESISPFVEVVELGPHGALFFQGDFPDGVFILLEGELKAFLVKPSGKMVTVGHVYPVEIVGELGALSGEPRSMTVEAVHHSVGLRLPTDIFRSLCEKHPALLKEIANRVVQRSIKNIKFMTQESQVKNAVMIYPIVDPKKYAIIKGMVRSYLNEDDITILASDEMTKDQIVRRVLHAQKELKTIVVILHQWDDSYMLLADDYSVRMMVMLEAEEMNVHQEEVRSALSKFNHHPKLELDLVLLHQEGSRRNEHTASYLRLAHFKSHHHITIGNAEDYNRLYRFITGKAIALVLGGGGGRGFMHVGLFKALAERKIKIDAIGGTSIGAGMAACYAMANGSYDEMYERVTKIKEAMLRSLSARNIVWPVISVYSGNPITDAMQEIFGDYHIEDFQIPYFSVAADLGSQQEIVHDRGLVWKAVRASGSIPAIFPPMLMDGRILLDGGLLNNLPVDVMREKIGGGHTIIASSLSKQGNKKAHYDFPPTIGLGQSLLSTIPLRKAKYPSFYSIFRDSLLLGSSYAENKNAHAADVLIRPSLDKFNTIYLSPEAEEKLVDIGYQHGIEMLDKHFGRKK